jgi:hypothetical protein
MASELGTTTLPASLPVLNLALARGTRKPNNDNNLIATELTRTDIIDGLHDIKAEWLQVSNQRNLLVDRVVVVNRQPDVLSPARNKQRGSFLSRFASSFFQMAPFLC